MKDKLISKNYICDQCGLPFSSSGIERLENNSKLHFCCYGCSFTHSILSADGKSGTAALFLARLGFSAFLSMNIMIISWVIYDKQWITLGVEPNVLPILEKLLFVLATPIMILVGYPYLKNMIKEIHSLRMSMDSLIAIGSFAAYLFSTYQVFKGGKGVYFDTGTMVIVLVTFGRYLEANAKIKTSNAISKLISLQPDTSRTIRDGIEQLIPTNLVSIGEIIKVLPGERVPLDGIVVGGVSSINESILTGEAINQTKKKGDKVYAATYNIDGVLLIQTTTNQQETLHARIVQMIDEAQLTKSHIQKVVDKIASIFIPLIIILSGLTLIVWLFFTTFDIALLHALTVLVVACPCALGIGTPIATTIALGKAAECGVLIKSTEVFEKLASSKNIVFDKTGTLTKGNFTISTFSSIIDDKKFLSIVYSIEKDSEHFISKSILSYVKEKQMSFFDSRNIRAVPGYGIVGEVKIDGRWVTVFIGSRQFLEKNSFKFKNEFGNYSSNDELLKVFVGWDSIVYGMIELKDNLRENAKDVIRLLKEWGMKTVLLSGDTIRATKTVADVTCISEYFGEQLPKDKIEKIKMLKESGVTVMVGDGINDAPSLASADVGITLASATDIAKETADVTIIGDHLENVTWIIAYSKETLRTIKWNLFWAFGYNSVGILLAIFGVLQPIIAAIAMIVSSLVIIINSRKLRSSLPC